MKQYYMRYIHTYICTYLYMCIYVENYLICIHYLNVNGKGIEMKDLLLLWLQIRPRLTSLQRLSPDSSSCPLLSVPSSLSPPWGNPKNLMLQPNNMPQAVPATQVMSPWSWEKVIKNIMNELPFVNATWWHCHSLFVTESNQPIPTFSEGVQFSSQALRNL